MIDWPSTLTLIYVVGIFAGFTVGGIAFGEEVFKDNNETAVIGLSLFWPLTLVALSVGALSIAAWKAISMTIGGGVSVRRTINHRREKAKVPIAKAVRQSK